MRDYTFSETEVNLQLTMSMDEHHSESGRLKPALLIAGSHRRVISDLLFD